MIEFVEDEKGYEVRVLNGDKYDYEVAGELEKGKDGVWYFSYEDQSVAYEDDLKETENYLKGEFEIGWSDDMLNNFGSFSYKK